jgi:hypothetical protein
MNVSDLTNLVVGLALIYFGWQQNQIFKRQNEIFATQAGITMPPKKSKMALLLRYWPMLAMAALAVAMWLAAVYDRIGNHVPVGATAIAVPWVLVAVLLVTVVYSRKSHDETKGLQNTIPPKPKFGKLTIHSARWVVKDDDQHYIEAEASLRSHIKESLMDTIDIALVNQNLGGDPLKETHKVLKLVYSYGEGIQKKIIKHEGGHLTLPEPPEADKAIDAPLSERGLRPAPGLTIQSAHYGRIPADFADVTVFLQAQVRNNRLSVKVEDALFNNYIDGYESVMKRILNPGLRLLKIVYSLGDIKDRFSARI